jgi:predicted oxidoreductase (fatty acid repression mutant protein)
LPLVWTALEREGLGCNLQHYNFSANFVRDVAETWNLPKTWSLKSQLVFGKPTAGPDRVKTFNPIDGERLLVFS